MLHYCTCKVFLAGDLRQSVIKSGQKAVSWPETMVLEYIHSKDSVVDIAFSHEVASDVRTEKDRLISIYGAKVVNELFPGVNPTMPMQMPGAKPATSKATQASPAKPKKATRKKAAPKESPPDAEVPTPEVESEESFPA